MLRVCCIHILWVGTGSCPSLRWSLGYLARVWKQIIAHPQDNGLVLFWQLTIYQPAHPVGSSNALPLKGLSPGEILAAIGHGETQFIDHRSNDNGRRRLLIECGH